MRRLLLLVLCSVAVIYSGGCGGTRTLATANTLFYLTPADGLVIDTNCTGCNSTGPKGAPVLQIRANLLTGGAASVTWHLEGGDPLSGTGTIDARGRYTPPSFLSTDEAEVHISAIMANGPTASTTLHLRPGFLAPISPENAALAPGASLRLTGTLALAGGTAPIHFRLAANADGSGLGVGSLSPANCQHSPKSFATCSVTYTAPRQLAANTSLYVVAELPRSPARNGSLILLNPQGITSSPLLHQSAATAPIALGSSASNAADFDATGNRITDCCGGTLGALLTDPANHRYLLGNNHVLARSDQASLGDPILAPGLIDNNCSPAGGQSRPVAHLRHWLPLSSPLTNADAALADIAPRELSPNILELGPHLPDGTLAPSPIGISTSGSHGIPASLGQSIAKSGRTTGLTCGQVSALDLEILVDYYRDCAESRPYLTHHFSHQIAVSGNQFTDSGDSGSLFVDSATAEPVALYFAGGRDEAGVAHAVATPAPAMLAELSTSFGAPLSFVGAADHPVTCLSYGDSGIAFAEAHPLAAGEESRLRIALPIARHLVNPAAGILSVEASHSLDHPGEAALLFRLDARFHGTLPQTIAGLRTRYQMPASAAAKLSLDQARALKDKLSAQLFRRSPAIFGLGLTYSLDHPGELALLLYVDRNLPTPELPATLSGLRLRILALDRLHVTRSFLPVAESHAPTSCHIPEQSR